VSMLAWPKWAPLRSTGSRSRSDVRARSFHRAICPLPVALSATEEIPRERPVVSRSKRRARIARLAAGGSQPKTSGWLRPVAIHLGATPGGIRGPSADAPRGASNRGHVPRAVRGPIRSVRIPTEPRRSGSMTLPATLPNGSRCRARSQQGEPRATFHRARPARFALGSCAVALGGRGSRLSFGPGSAARCW